MRLFWKAAGADRYILERSTYGDQVKYLCLGGIIVATGLMAGLAGGYAFYTIFEPRGNAIDSFKTTAAIGGNHDITDLATMFKAIVFGIIWGLIIFNIDRFIISSTGKGDGTEDITGKELKGALPRLLMGAIIAMTISKPVEIRMFKTEIDIKLHEKQIEQQQIYKAKTDSVFNSELSKKDKEIEKTETELSNKRSRYQSLEQNYIEEARLVTVGPRALAVKQQMDGLAAEIKSLEADPDYLRVKKEKEEIEDRRTAALNQSEKYAAGLDGLLERIKIGHEISGPAISWFITLLFMAIELTPIFFKLMLIKSPYDYMEENIKELIKAENAIEIQHNYYQDKQGHERDKVVQHQVIRLLKEKIALLEAQSQLSEAALEQWTEKKKEGIAANPEAFVTESAVPHNNVTS
ncbi:DUF4407 domain-containing protein [Niabella sp.]|uniref:DUF4407 domain-containing protein n=1 Tax=Niabella sp. TaxID=1962976 RepID=UPI002621B18F|nr:DUF4407 domain-containing protein [Niabella sp.]